MLMLNAQETRDNISLILYAGCLGLSPVISAKISRVKTYIRTRIQKYKTV